MSKARIWGLWKYGNGFHHIRFYSRVYWSVLYSFYRNSLLRGCRTFFLLLARFLSLFYSAIICIKCSNVEEVGHWEAHGVQILVLYVNIWMLKTERCLRAGRGGRGGRRRGAWGEVFEWVRAFYPGSLLPSLSARFYFYWRCLVVFFSLGRMLKEGHMSLVCWIIFFFAERAHKWKTMSVQHKIWTFIFFTTNLHFFYTVVWHNDPLPIITAATATSTLTLRVLIFHRLSVLLFLKRNVLYPLVRKFYLNRSSLHGRFTGNGASIPMKFHS